MKYYKINFEVTLKGVKHNLCMYQMSDGNETPKEEESLIAAKDFWKMDKYKFMGYDVLSEKEYMETLKTKKV